MNSGQSATIDGAWGSARGLALAALAAAGLKPLVIVVPKTSEVNPLLGDLATFGTVGAQVLPALEDLSDRGSSLAATEIFGRRLAVLKSLATEPPPVLVAPMAAVLQPVPSVALIERSSRRLTRGKPVQLNDLLHWLEANGWPRRDAVELPGEYSLRGGIFDIFPFDATDPFRIELFGDDVESIREFSVDSQRSLREVDSVELTSFGESTDDEMTHLAQLLPPTAPIALVEPLELKEEGRQYLARSEETSGLFSVEEAWARLVARPTVIVSSLPHPTVETVCSLRIESVERFSGEVGKVKDELDRTVGNESVLLLAHNEGERQRLGEILADARVASEGRLVVSVGRLAAGFRWVTAGVVILSDHELFHRTDLARAEPRRRHQSRAIDSFLDLQPGDYVVHLGHGIGIFHGMKMLDKNDQLEEHLVLEFADETLIYVPASKIDLVQKYVGASQSRPKLSRVGGRSWERRKQAAKAAVTDLAAELLEVQAARAAQPGTPMPPDSEWQKEFDAAFPYTETPDQLLAIGEIKRDMESARPMDRLLCGDVGYGKTELAMRAAFKAVDFGKQVAVLVPTTVLAQQHLRTFRERMAEFPFVVECLSRFQSGTEKKRILAGVQDGSVDILIGTHRLLSGDIHFQDLGLLVIDEEQRFGVEHKEKLKRLRSQVDVLTMTATPIPRTLHAALLGIRDISNLETAPPNRLAVETRVCRFDAVLIRHAVLRELNRAGQIYFVHNRVQDIQLVRDKLARIVPEAKVAVIHGQMPEHEIEQGMLAFLERRVDILLATTIIESGLDIPSANTIFLDEGDIYGLADLHQLRGRVGRSNVRAYCYVLVDESKVLRPDAQRRLKAIEEYSALGSGFQIALRDLEIRGAGNILGTEQSGHIAAIGYELYCQLLENAVRAQKKLPIQSHLDVTIELPWKAYLPHNYLPGERYRIDVYRRLARARSIEDLETIRAELVDRAGPLPEIARHFLDLAELRLLAQIWQVESVRPDGDGSLVLKVRNSRRGETLERLRPGELKMVDAATAYAWVPRAEQQAQGYAARLKRLLQPN